jgi:predicted DNA-binding transcriptional regulator
MNPQKFDAVEVWKQLEDVMVPRLRLPVIDHAVYSYLVRHSRLEGKLRLRFSILGLARHVRVSGGSAREAVRRLVDQGALRLVERSKAGYLVEVRLPEEIRAARPDAVEAGGAADLPGAGGLEETDFMKSRELRRAIHAREGGICFYCLRRTAARMQCLDHVVPRTQLGRNSYRNLVSCCLECNSQKGERRAGDFLRWLYREGRLAATELTGRLCALEALAAGKMRPALQGNGDLGRKRG